MGGPRHAASDELDDAELATELSEAGLAPAVSRHDLVFNPNNATTPAVERLQLADGAVVVRKVAARDRPATVPHWAAGRAESHWNHWRREVAAYDSALTDGFGDAGLPAPRPVGRATPRDGVEVLFLAHVEGRSAGELSADDLVLVARRLGTAQGRLRPPADPPAWWSRSWTRAYATSRPPGPSVLHDPVAWEHPVVIEGFGEARHELRRGWGEVMAELPAWFDLLDRLPATVVHNDCWSNNLLVDDEAQGTVATTLIDWTFVGVGAVGSDPGTLVTAGFLDHHGDPADLANLDAAAFQAYADGLAEGGWPHPPELSRLAMCASAVRVAWLPGLMVHNAGWRGPTGYGGRPGPSHVEVFRRRAVVLTWLLERLREARRLAAEAAEPYRLG